MSVTESSVATSILLRIAQDIDNGKIPTNVQFYLFLFAIEVKKLLIRLKYSQQCSLNCSLVTRKFSKWRDHVFAYFHVCLHLVDKSSVDGSFNFYSLVLGIDSESINNRSKMYFKVFSQFQSVILNHILDGFHTVDPAWVNLCQNNNE